jgi:hypothetical protein
MATECGRERDNEMAGKTEADWTEATTGAAANDTNGANDGWATVEDEVQIALENEGDGFIGTYVDMDVTGTGIAQAHFTNVTDLNGNFIAARAFINSTRDLTNKLKTISYRRQVRAVWTTSMNTGQPLPMRVFSVQSR